MLHEQPVYTGCPLLNLPQGMSDADHSTKSGGRWPGPALAPVARAAGAGPLGQVARAVTKLRKFYLNFEVGGFRDFFKRVASGPMPLCRIG